MKFDHQMKTDIGTTRKSNQDFLCAETVETAFGEAFLGIICDGMGGLSFGELASRTTAGYFTDWFQSEFRYIMSTENLFANLQSQWNGLIEAANRDLLAFGAANGCQIGTTLSALLLFNGSYYVAQIGDSRVYRGKSSEFLRITSDHSVVAEMTGKGLLTKDEARVSSKRNALTRCVGAMRQTSADYFTGSAENGAFFVLSSDGFHGRIREDRLSAWFSGYERLSTKKQGSALEKMIREKKRIGEKDNISVLTVVIKDARH